MSITALVGIGFTSEVQKTLGAAKTISAITKASEGVCTSTSHGFSNGDYIVLTVSGMSRLNNLAARVKSVSTNEFTLEGVDTTDYPDFVSGTAKEITAWDTIGWATSWNLNGGSPQTIATTTLDDVELQEQYGMSAAGSGTIDGLDQIADTAMLNLRAASEAQATRVFRLTYSGGQIRLFNANVSAGGGFQLSVNDAGKMSVSVTVRGKISEFAS